MTIIQRDIQILDPAEVGSWREWSYETTTTTAPTPAAWKTYTRHLLINEYITRAIQTAVYEKIEGGRLFASIPGLTGVWADGASFLETRHDLARAVHGWVVLKVRDRDGDIPVIQGLDLNGSAAT